MTFFSVIIWVLTSWYNYIKISPLSCIKELLQNPVCFGLGNIRFKGKVAENEIISICFYSRQRLSLYYLSCEGGLQSIVSGGSRSRWVLVHRLLDNFTGYFTLIRDFLLTSSTQWQQHKQIWAGAIMVFTLYIHTPTKKAKKDGL